MVETDQGDRLASEGIKYDGGVDEHGGGDQGDEGCDGPSGSGAAAPEPPELDLDDVNESEHEEAASKDGADGGGKDAGAKQHPVDARSPGVAGLVDEADGLLEAESDEAGEEEGSEGENVEGDHVLRHLVPGGAVAGGEGAVRGVGWVPGEAHEDGQGKEGVHVDDAVQCRDVDARPSAAVGSGAPPPLVVVSVNFAVVHLEKGGDETAEEGGDRVESSAQRNGEG